MVRIVVFFVLINAGKCFSARPAEVGVAFFCTVSPCHVGVVAFAVLYNRINSNDSIKSTIHNSIDSTNSIDGTRYFIVFIVSI